MTSVPPPKPLALVVCERVVVGANGAPSSFQGLIYEAKCPAVFPSTAIHFEYIDAKPGKQVLELRITEADGETNFVDPGSMEVIIESPLHIRVATVEIEDGLRFEKSGMYRVQIRHAGELVIERPIWIV